MPVVDGRHPHIVAQFLPELSQPCRAPLAPAAQGEVGADPQRAQRHTGHDLPHEIGGAQRGGGTVEGQDQHEVQPQRGQQIGAFFGRGEVGQRQVRAQDSHRVGIEGEQPGAAAGRVRGLNHLADEHLVAAVYAIEVSDGQERGAVQGLSWEAEVCLHGVVRETCCVMRVRIPC